VRLRLTGLDDDHLAAASGLLERCYGFLAGVERWTDGQLDGVVALRGSVEALREQREAYRFVLAWSDGELVGLVAVRQDEITKMYVDPEHHRRGVGRQLWRAAADLVGDAGFDEVRLVTTGYGTALYEAMGMQVVGTKVVDRGPMKGRTVTELRGPVP
jgi:ribosomal protein S18 acetylase RimI-like enzyme